ncbi:MAG TPA: hydrogenase maturation nickel metallochaperone HypA [Pirellulales bacterium]|jgi:hydrogenase nickel incorporation protein HypA/HybF|nr:hydrogenase maturation nickel metallochaperone HypA [Pirellulales bacterium]
MHELSIALSILDIAAEELERQGGGCVVAVHLKIGPLAGVVKEALNSAFELAREESTLKEAKLVIEDIPIAVYCAQCQCEQAIDSWPSLCCGQCGTPATDIIRGRELEMVALEIES